MGRTWTLLEYDSEETLGNSIEDREERVLFYPAVGQMKAGQHVDIEVAVPGFNILIPMRALVVARRTRPRGQSNPRGVYLKIIEPDADRFQRLCDFADGSWRPGTRRASPRLRAEIGVSYFVPPRFFRGETLDISSQGMFVRTDGDMPPVGQGVFVKLHASRLWFPIRLSAKICWVDTVSSRRGMGIYCFEPPRALRRLKNLVRRLRRRYLA